PDSSVMTERVAPVSVLRTVTVTPPMPEPVWSRTLPEMEAVTCANASVPTQRAMSVLKRTSQSEKDLIGLSLQRWAARFTAAYRPAMSTSPTEAKGLARGALLTDNYKEEGLCKRWALDKHVENSTPERLISAFAIIPYDPKEDMLKSLTI